MWVILPGQTTHVGGPDGRWVTDMSKHLHSSPRLGRRGLVVAFAAVGLLAASVNPVVGQETQDSTPSTTAPPTTAAPTTSPETTAAPSTEAPTTAPSTTAPVDDGNETTESTDDSGQPTTTLATEEGSEEKTVATDEDGNPIIDIEDPGSHEESFETPPEVDVTVPPPEDPDGRYQGQGGYQAEQVLVSSVNEARVKLAAAEEEHLRAVSVVKTFRLRLKRLQAEQLELDEETTANLILLEEAELRLRARALSAFVRGGTMQVGDAVDPEGALDFEAQQTIADIVFEDDDELIRDYQETRDNLGRDALSLFDRTRTVADSLANAESDIVDLVADIEQAQRELEAFEAGSQIYISGVVFPIQWPYEVPLIDSWGFPRMTGTSDEHWHEGIDIFAPTGTPLLATERGIVTRIGSGRLGGMRLWLRGESGTDWYYAHLSGFAPGLTEGQVVEAGDVIGYVGNTGNAVGTPPHLHMQVHPNGGEPVNPYPLLFVVSTNELAEAGIEP